LELKCKKEREIEKDSYIRREGIRSIGEKRDRDKRKVGEIYISKEGRSRKRTM